MHFIELNMRLLSEINPHVRDSEISFEEKGHIYTIGGDSGFTSVTTWNHSHFKKFDADVIIASMMASKSWPKSKYYGNTAEEIKAIWDKNRDEAAEAGTKMHFDIEQYYNGLPVSNNTCEFQQFMRFAQSTCLTPYRTEWMIWDKKLRLAGSIDMVFIADDGSLMIYDWKRSKGINKTNSWGDYSIIECISHLPDSNFWHYSLQLNTYKAILERNYGYKVSVMRLVCMHPCHHDFQVINVPDLSQEIDDLFTLRAASLV